MKSKLLLLNAPSLLSYVYRVYFGQNKRTVRAADETSTEYLGSVSGEVNVKFLKRSGVTVQAGKWYFWRVDAVTKEGDVVKGDVWRFKAI